MDIDDIIQLLNASKNLRGEAKRSFLTWVQGRLNAVNLIKEGNNVPKS